MKILKITILFFVSIKTNSLAATDGPQPSHVGPIHINPPDVPEHLAPKPLIIQPMYVKPKLRMATSKVINNRKLMYKKMQKNFNKNYLKNMQNRNLSNFQNPNLNNNYIPPNFNPNFNNNFANPNFNANYKNNFANQNLNNKKYQNLSINPRKLTYTHSFPFAPYDFYNLPDKGTEMPFNVMNYGSKMPAEPDESIKERKRKNDSKQNMIKYDNSKTRFGEIENEVGNIDGELKNMINHLKKGFGKIDQKLMLLHNSQYTLL